MVTWNETHKKFINFADTYNILSNLEKRKIEVGLISDGSRRDLELVEDQNLLSKFKIIVMSEDDDVQVSKPGSKNFPCRYIEDEF